MQRLSLVDLRLTTTAFTALALAAPVPGCDSGPAPGAETGGTEGEETDDDESEGDDDTADDGSTGGPPTGAGPTTGVDPTDETTGGDPCGACDPIAACVDSACVCPDGYDGDGETCTDVDECAEGGANCDANASCTNEPGGFTCACNDGYVGDGTDCAPAVSCADDPCDANANCADDADGFSCTCDDGYEGDGFSCDDIDECAGGGGGCDDNASCENEDGGYDCDCNDGFEGDGFSCVGTAEYGDACVDPAQCASGLCVGSPYDACSELCSPDVANDCPNVDASGFCVPLADGEFACVGELDTEFDGDDEILQVGDSAVRFMDTLTDADLFHLERGAGDFLIEVIPSAGIDVQLDVYNEIGQFIGSLDDTGLGGVEAGILSTAAAGTSFAVVRNSGVTTGSYSISLTISP